MNYNNKVMNRGWYKGHGIYIGRPSKWGNPYRIGDKGMNRKEVVAAHKRRLWQQIKDGEVTLEELAELDGKLLLCWCAPKACHGDTLVKAAAWAVSELAKKG